MTEVGMNNVTCLMIKARSFDKVWYQQSHMCGNKKLGGWTKIGMNNVTCVTKKARSFDKGYMFGVESGP